MKKAPCLIALLNSISVTSAWFYDVTRPCLINIRGGSASDDRPDTDLHSSTEIETDALDDLTSENDNETDLYFDVDVTDEEPCIKEVRQAVSAEESDLNSDFSVNDGRVDSPEYVVVQDTAVYNSGDGMAVVDESVHVNGNMDFQEDYERCIYSDVESVYDLTHDSEEDTLLNTSPNELDKTSEFEATVSPDEEETAFMDVGMSSEDLDNDADDEAELSFDNDEALHESGKDMYEEEDSIFKDVSNDSDENEYEGTVSSSEEETAFMDVGMSLEDLDDQADDEAESSFENDEAFLKSVKDVYEEEDYGIDVSNDSDENEYEGNVSLEEEEMAYIEVGMSSVELKDVSDGDLDSSLDNDEALLESGKDMYDEEDYFHDISNDLEENAFDRQVSLEEHETVYTEISIELDINVDVDVETKSPFDDDDGDALLESGKYMYDEKDSVHVGQVSPNEEATKFTKPSVELDGHVDVEVESSYDDDDAFLESGKDVYDEEVYVHDSTNDSEADKEETAFTSVHMSSELDSNVDVEAESSFDEDDAFLESGKDVYDEEVYVHLSTTDSEENEYEGQVYIDKAEIAFTSVDKSLELDNNADDEAESSFDDDSALLESGKEVYDEEDFPIDVDSKFDVVREAGVKDLDQDEDIIEVDSATASDLDHIALAEFDHSEEGQDQIHQSLGDETDSHGNPVLISLTQEEEEAIQEHEEAFPDVHTDFNDDDNSDADVINDNCDKKIKDAVDHHIGIPNPGLIIDRPDDEHFKETAHTLENDIIDNVDEDKNPILDNPVENGIISSGYDRSVFNSVARLSDTFDQIPERSSEKGPDLYYEDTEEDNLESAPSIDIQHSPSVLLNDLDQDSEDDEHAVVERVESASNTFTTMHTENEGSDIDFSDTTTEVTADNGAIFESVMYDDSDIFDEEFDRNHEGLEITDFYPTGSDSAAFVDRMDLADAYDHDRDTDGLETKVIMRDLYDEAPLGKTINVAPEKDPSLPIQDEERKINNDAKLQKHPDDISNIAFRDTVINNAMKNVLCSKLGYSSLEVRSMKPPIATVLVNKMFKRPQAGLPAEYFADEILPIEKMKRRRLRFPFVRGSARKNDTHQALYRLGYSNLEVQAIKPGVAEVIVQKSFKRPKNGPPPEIFIGESIPKDENRLLGLRTNIFRQQ